MTQEGQKLASGSAAGAYRLRARRLGIDSQYEAIVYMRSDCHVCRAEGFAAHNRVRLTNGDRSIIATLHHVTGALLLEDEAGLSESAWHRLDLHADGLIAVNHPEPLESLGKVRGKVYGRPLD